MVRYSSGLKCVLAIKQIWWVDKKGYCFRRTLTSGNTARRAWSGLGFSDSEQPCMGGLLCYDINFTSPNLSHFKVYYHFIEYFSGSLANGQWGQVVP